MEKKIQWLRRFSINGNKKWIINGLVYGEYLQVQYGSQGRMILLWKIWCHLYILTEIVQNIGKFWWIQMQKRQLLEPEELRDIRYAEFCLEEVLTLLLE